MIYSQTALARFYTDYSVKECDLHFKNNKKPTYLWSNDGSLIIHIICLFKDHALYASE